MGGRRRGEGRDVEGRGLLGRGGRERCTGERYKVDVYYRRDGTRGVNGNWERHKEEGYKSEEWRGGRMRADTEGRG